jgi:phosphate transport system ATP-binding protein
VKRSELFPDNIARRHRLDRGFRLLTIAATSVGFVALAILLTGVLAEGLPWLSWDFLDRFPSRKPEMAGFKSAFWGSLWVIGLTTAITVPIGVAGAVYLEEYSGESRFQKLIELLIANLAGVPSILYGMLGLIAFVRMFQETTDPHWSSSAVQLPFGRSVLAGACTLSLLVLPVLTIATREALRAVPDSLRKAAFGLGATRWQCTRHHVLPAALPGILTGVVLSISRALGETAPLIMMGALTYVAFTPASIVRSVHHDADPDLQLGRPSAARVPLGRRGGHHRPPGRSARHERPRRPAAQPRRALPPLMTLSKEPPKPKTAQGVLETHKVSIYYGDTAAVKGVSLKVPERQVMAIIGPSGCGKSTLLRCFNRMNDFIDGCRLEGAVLFDGEDINAPSVDPVRLRQRIGMVFQRPNPFPKSIRANITWAPKMAGYQGDYEELVERCLHEAALWDETKDKLDESALSLSGGQQQRLCIARSLAMSPEVLLMDEPCSALDPIATGRIEELIRALREHYTVAIVTHNLQQAGRIADRTAFMYQGELIEVDETSKLFTQPSNQKTEDYITGRFG